MGAQVNTTGITNIYNLIILDESGSMTSIYEQALGGANETIQTIRVAQASANALDLPNVVLPKSFVD